MNFQTTISGKEFCRRNCGNYGKEKFFEEYYRILHTAYLRSDNNSCLDVIRNDFENSFGSELDNVSVSYIYATAKYLVYDVVVAALLSDGRIDSQYYYNKLIVELGFDVWLIYTMEKGVRPTMNDFYNWQPLEKNRKTESVIDDFWHFKLPKAHKFSHLYDGIKQYKKEILEAYRRLLLAKHDTLLDNTAVNLILSYIDSCTPRKSEVYRVDNNTENTRDFMKNVSANENVTKTEEISNVADNSETVPVKTEEDAVIASDSLFFGETKSETEPVSVNSEPKEEFDSMADAPENADDSLEYITAQDEMLETELSVMDSLDGPATIEEMPHAIGEIIENHDDAVEVNVNTLKAADRLFVPDYFEETVNTEETAEPEKNQSDVSYSSASVDNLSDSVKNIIENQSVTSQSAVDKIVETQTLTTGPVVEKFVFPHLDADSEINVRKEEKQFKITKPVFEKIEKPVPEKVEIAASGKVEKAASERVEKTASGNKSVEKTTKSGIKIVSPADYIPYKKDPKTFSANRNRETLRGINKIENTDGSSRGFKKNCHEITKDKLITAAVCVGVAGVMLVPFAIACFGKGKKK